MSRVNSTPLILNGRNVADEVLGKIKVTVETLKAQNKRVPGLAVILVGDNPASQTYIKNKTKTTKKIGFYSEIHKLPASTQTKEVITLITSLNSNKNIDGILVQLPLPQHIKGEIVLSSIDPNKDVDGLHPFNLGKLLSSQICIKPCTPNGVIQILKHYSIDIAGKLVVIVGRSTLVGKPLSILLLNENATVTTVHSKTKDIEKITKSADILISAVGKPRLINKNWIKPGVIIVDIGINEVIENGKAKLVGDVDFESVIPICKAITPVPGGVGPMTIAMLMENTLLAYMSERVKD